MDLGYYFRIFLRRLVWVILFVAIGGGVGFYFATTLPAVYEAEARLLVESEQIPDELAASTVQTAATEQIQIIQQRILTREVLLEMANRLNIYGNQRIPASDKVADLRSRISITVRGGRSGQATLVDVSFRADQAQQAATVTNEVVTLILKENVAMRTTVSGQTLDFFTQEVDRLGQEMSRLSARMLAFQEENLDSLPDSLDFRRSRQASVQERLAALDRNEDALKDRRNRLVELFEDTGFVPSESGEQLSVEARQLVALKRDYSSSVAILSLDNPKIAVLRARIAALEKVVAEQQNEAAASAADSSEAAAPPSAFELQLADIDAQIAAIERQRVELEAQMEDLVSTISETPGNTVTLQAMRRDYQNLQTQYNQAVANKARAETGDMIEALSKGQRISLVEQAIAPQEPVSPDRPLLLAAGVGGGFAAALALIVLLELLNSAIRRPSELGDKLGIAALASVPFIETKAQIRRRRVLRASVAAVVVLVGLGGAWFVLGQGAGIGGDLIQRILSQLNSLKLSVLS